MLQALLLVAVVGMIAFGAANYESHPLPADAHADRVVVEKSARKLTLFRSETPLKSYSVALGRAPEGTKEREGDHRTPEGRYVIDAHKLDSAFQPLVSLHSRADGTAHGVTAAVEYDGRVFAAAHGDDVVVSVALEDLRDEE